MPRSSSTCPDGDVSLLAMSASDVSEMNRIKVQHVALPVLVYVVCTSLAMFLSAFDRGDPSGFEDTSTKTKRGKLTRCVTLIGMYQYWRQYTCHRGYALILNPPL